MSFKKLPTAFPWYSRLERQNRFRENVRNLAEYGLLSPRDGLLPFQFMHPGQGVVQNWVIFNRATGALVATMDSGSLSQVRTVVRESRRYFYYGGGLLNTTGGGGLALSEGLYYSRIGFSDGTNVFSEVFRVPACSWGVGGVSDFLKLEWWNDTDLRPIFYQDLSLGLPYFRNIVYLDTFVHTSEPEVLEEGEKDGDDKIVPTFQKAIVKYRVTDLVPDFLKVALVVMQMHDHVILTTPGGMETGEIDSIITNTQSEQGGGFSTVDIIYQEEIAMIKKGCGDNMAP
jgi:hypothetical protein